MERLFAVLTIVCLALAIAACSDAGGQDQAFQLTPENNRKAAPVFSVKALNGDGTLSLDDLRGTPVVLNFWASWCEPCKKETPDLIAFAKAHPEVRVVGIAVNDEPKDSRAFAAQYKVTYDLGSDPDAETQDLIGFPGLPATYFLDAEGRYAADPKFGPVVPDDLNAFAAAFGP
jgi:thiol-disulfide isomerase/thioredoxin